MIHVVSNPCIHTALAELYLSASFTSPASTMFVSSMPATEPILHYQAYMSYMPDSYTYTKSPHFLPCPRRIHCPKIAIISFDSYPGEPLASLSTSARRQKRAAGHRGEKDESSAATSSGRAIENWRTLLGKLSYWVKLRSKRPVPTVRWR